MTDEGGDGKTAGAVLAAAASDECWDMSMLTQRIVEGGAEISPFSAFDAGTGHRVWLVHGHDGPGLCSLHMRELAPTHQVTIRGLADIGYVVPCTMDAPSLGEPVVVFVASVAHEEAIFHVNYLTGEVIARTTLPLSVWANNMLVCAVQGHVLLLGGKVVHVAAIGAGKADWTHVPLPQRYVSFAGVGKRSGRVFYVLIDDSLVAISTIGPSRGTRTTFSLDETYVLRTLGARRAFPLPVDRLVYETRGGRTLLYTEWGQSYDPASSKPTTLCSVASVFDADVAGTDQPLALCFDRAGIQQMRFSRGEFEHRIGMHRRFVDTTEDFGVFTEELAAGSVKLIRGVLNRIHIAS